MPAEVKEGEGATGVAAKVGGKEEPGARAEATEVEEVVVALRVVAGWEWRAVRSEEARAAVEAEGETEAALEKAVVSQVGMVV